MRIPRVCSLLTWYSKVRQWCYSHPQVSPFSWSPPWLVCARYRRHQAGQHGGAHRGDHSGRVPPPSLQHLRVQQQQRDNPAVWHAGVGPVWQAHQMWVASKPRARGRDGPLAPDMWEEKGGRLEGFDLLSHLRHTGSKETTRVGLTRESVPCLVFW